MTSKLEFPLPVGVLTEAIIKPSLARFPLIPEELLELLEELLELFEELLELLELLLDELEEELLNILPLEDDELELESPPPHALSNSTDDKSGKIDIL